MPREANDELVCPHCGAGVPAGRRFCRACGASEDSGWDFDGPAWEHAEDNLDDFDYDDYVSREFPDSQPAEFNLKKVLVSVIVVLVLIGLLLSALL